ncbi:MAG TPA: hypothetical protein DCZ01_11680 [Elusimicrobia bacterium]|nr:MAG: hypothetical protein A2X37_09850 [Elusimicrobia bacterium GWA2_66_18]HAZ09153.1 hypothetical protein [Elusimicrobiota bacterium]
MKLLIVEDDDDAASFMQYIMEQEQYSVLAARTMSDAKRHLEDFTPDLIIMDRGLPDADGLDFCRELKSDPRFSRVPVLFVSSAKSPSEVAAGFAAGGDDYVIKPFFFIELVARTHALLRRAEMSRA